MTRPKPTAPSRARARDAAQVDTLVEEIAERMADGRWQTGASHRELAAREGTSVAAVEKWAAQAGRLLRTLSAVDRDELRARNAARLDVVYGRAMGEADDLKAAVSALAEQAKLLGLNEPTKVDVHHTAAAFESKPLPAQLAEVEEHIAALEAVRDDLRAQLATDATPGESGAQGVTNNVMPAKAET